MLIEHANGALRYAEEARKTMQNDPLDTASTSLKPRSSRVRTAMLASRRNTLKTLSISCRR